MANFLARLVGTGAGSLVEAVGEAIDRNTTTDEERRALEHELAKADRQYELEMARLGLQERQLLLADTNSAREHETRVQESEHASWLAKNVHPVLAIGILGLTFFMYWYIVFSDHSAKVLADSSQMKDIVIYILGALTTVATQVVSYFFGSSSGSADKSKVLHSLAQKGNSSG